MSNNSETSETPTVDLTGDMDADSDTDSQRTVLFTQAYPIIPSRYDAERKQAKNAAVCAHRMLSYIIYERLGMKWPFGIKYSHGLGSAHMQRLEITCVDPRTWKHHHDDYYFSKETGDYLHDLLVELAHTYQYDLVYKNSILVPQRPLRLPH